MRSVYLRPIGVSLDARVRTSDRCDRLFSTKSRADQQEGFNSANQDPPLCLLIHTHTHCMHTQRGNETESSNCLCMAALKSEGEIAVPRPGPNNTTFCLSSAHSCLTSSLTSVRSLRPCQQNGVMRLSEVGSARITASPPVALSPPLLLLL